MKKMIAYRPVMMVLVTMLLSWPLMGMEILVPQNRALLHEAFVTVVVDIADTPVEGIEIVTDANRSYTLVPNAGKSVYCKKVPLQLGENRIEIRSMVGSKVEASEGLSLYYTSEVEQAFRYPPKFYRTQFFHTEAAEARCASCHNMALNEVENVAFENVKDSNCYACHKELVGREHAHAPSVNWLCTSCHNGKTGRKNRSDAGRSKYLFPDPIGETCLSCHNDSQKETQRIGWEAKRYHHDPAEAGRCNRCHNPHSSDNVVQLRKPSWELCVGCHADKAEGMHVANISFVRAKHPTRGVADPSRPGKDLSCISCHNPHASNKRFFLPDDRGNQMICTMCHKK